MHWTCQWVARALLHLLATGMLCSDKDGIFDMECLYCSFLASHERAWQETRGRFPFSASASPLADELAWGTAATAHATSWMHVDDDGFGTAVTVKTGAKYWVVARHRNHSHGSSDLEFADIWDPQRPPSNDFDMEAVVLRPGSVL